MAKLVKKLSLKQGDTSEEFYFDATTGVKGYDYYTADETIVGRWVDGRPIYRRVFDQVMPSSDPNRVIWNFKGLNIDAILKVDGVAYAAYPNSNKHGFSLSGDWHNVVQSRWWVRYDEQYLYMQYSSSSGIGNNRAYVLVEYTKTTDQPDSFKEETIELTAEHKTGETFNGKPVYERIEESTNIQLGKWYSPTGIKTPNVEKVIEVSGYWDSGENGSVEPIAARVDASTYGSVIEYHQGTHSMSGEFAVYLGTSLSFVKNLRLKAKYTKTTD